MTTWTLQLDMTRKECHDETPIVACTLSDEGMNRPFDNGYGVTCGDHFTAWSEKRVYFPICYDGAEWVGSAPRHPCAEALEHQGGG